MKETKLMLRQIFGKRKLGVKYIRKLMIDDKKAPMLIVTPEQCGADTADRFIHWLSVVVNNSAIVNVDQFLTLPLKTMPVVVMLENVAQIDDLLKVRIAEAILAGKKLVVSLREHTALSFSDDPESVIYAPIGEFDNQKAYTEIEDILLRVMNVVE